MTIVDDLPLKLDSSSLLFGLHFCSLEEKHPKRKNQPGQLYLHPIKNKGKGEMNDVIKY